MIYNYCDYKIVIISNYNDRHPSHINKAMAKEDVMTVIMMIFIIINNDINNIWHSTNQLDWVQRLMVHLQNFLPHPPPPKNHFQSHPCLCHLI